MYGYIYETTNLIDGKKYIGQHVASEFDPSYKGSGKYLWNAINKHGWSNFSVRMLCPCFSQEELDAEEIDYIAHCNAVESPDYYNLQAGGQTGNIAGSRMSAEAKINMSLRNLRLGRWQGDDNPSRKLEFTQEMRLAISKRMKGLLVGPKNPMYGKHHSAATRKKISNKLSGENNPFYGKKHSDDTKKKISESRIGDKNPGANKIWITNGVQNKRVSPESLDVYINEGWRKGRLVSDETKRKHAESTKSRSRDSKGKFL